MSEKTWILLSIPGSEGMCTELLNPVRLSRSYVVSQPWRIAQALLAGRPKDQPASTANPAETNSPLVGNWFQFRMARKLGKNRFFDF